MKLTRDEIIERGWHFSANISPGGRANVVFYRLTPYTAFRGRTARDVEAARLAIKKWMNAQKKQDDPG